MAEQVFSKWALRVMMAKMASVWPLASAEPFVKRRCEKPFLFKQYLFAHYSLMESKRFFALMDFGDMRHRQSHSFIQESQTSNVVRNTGILANRTTIFIKQCDLSRSPVQNVNELVDFQKIELYIEEVL